MSGYEDNSVVTAAVNGHHSDINGETKNVPLKVGASSVLCCVTSRKCTKVSCEFPC